MIKSIVLSLAILFSVNSFAAQQVQLPKYAEMGAMGSGYFINQDGYIATAAHVIKAYKDGNVVHSVKSVKILFRGKLHLVQIVAVDSENDVAILKVNVNKPTPFFRYDTPNHFGPIFVAGFPDIFEYGFFIHTTMGFYKMDSGPLFLMDIVACHGNSGGAALDPRGNVIGTLDVGIAPEENECFKVSGAVDFKYTKELADRAHIQTYPANNRDLVPRPRTTYDVTKSMVEQEKVVFIMTQFN